LNPEVERAVPELLQRGILSDEGASLLLVESGLSTPSPATTLSFSGR